MNEQQLNQWFEEAQQLLQTNQHTESYKLLKKLDSYIPNHPGILYLTGICQSKAGNKRNAIASYQRVIQLHPNFVEAYNNLALDLSALDDFDKALSYFDAALQQRSDFVEAYHNKSVLLTRLRRFDEAIALLNQALRINPNYSDALASLGFVFGSLKDYQTAQKYSEAAISINTRDAKAYSNLASIFSSQNRRAEALAALRTAFSIDPDHDWLRGFYLDTLLRICEWENITQLKTDTLKAINAGRNACRPFHGLNFIADAKLQKKCAEHYVQADFPMLPTPISRDTKSSRCIRIGYFSSEFRGHAVSYLTAGLIEAHNREKFEIFGFDLSFEDKTSMRERVRHAFDHFLPAQHLSDLDVAILSRQHEIDIAIDLTGLTGEGRVEIFAQRAAPIQINYLGFPGTSGAPFMDYIIGDSKLIPQELQDAYTEKILYLPECFQANDDLRLIGKPKSRREYGLHECGVVYGCFNQSAKLNPEMFSSWMAVLKQVPDSRLWLIEDNPNQVKHLRQFADAHEVNPDRLVFAPQLPYEDHLARYKVIDLVLDTAPFNGGTTTSDALWGGAPVLTLIGEAFAGRMSASLLNAIGLEELIVTSPDDYTNLAISLGNDPERLASLKAKLLENRDTSPLFNTQRLTRHLEIGYEMIMNRYWSDQPTTHIHVPALPV